MTSKMQASGTLMPRIARYYAATHEQVLKVIEPLDERTMTWRPNTTAPSIVFHVWHMARWADYLQELITAADGQLWETNRLAEKWGMGDGDLGFAETGMGLSDDASASLRLPEKQVLLEYVRAAFAKAEEAVTGITDEDFGRVVEDRREVEGREVEIGEAILSWLKHENRHLGMIECMLGVQGMRGTATR
jgi:uncharacterized damage-inducible protein DinB